MAANKPAVGLVLLLVALAGSPVTRASGRGWFMATSDVASAFSDRADTAAGLLADLTTARVMMQQAAPVESLLPVRAFAVRNAGLLRELVPQYWEQGGVRPHGASYTGPHAAFVAVRTDVSSSQRFPLLLHEYVHLLTAATVANAPGWVDEGLSEFWGAAVLDGTQLTIGRPPAHHLRALRRRSWLSPDAMQQRQRRVLASDQADVAMFYAQSWAMVHYLLLGRDPNARPAFAPSERDWTPQLDAAVRAYVTEAKFRELTIEATETGAMPPSVQPIAEARALAERANMVVFGERPDAAIGLARKALSLNPRESLALEVTGTYYFLRNQPEQARVWLSQAFDADPGSYSSALYLALLATSARDREHYLLAAVKAKPDQLLARQRLWALYQEDGRAEQARHWCDQFADLLRPWVWMDQPFHCGAEDGR